jgi:hypothetical protein
MPAIFRGADGWGPPPSPPKTSGTATLALVSGVLSFVCLFGLGGVLAIALGWVAHSEIERSEGRLGGKGLASAGIGLGITNLVASVVGLGVLVAFAVRAEPSASSRGGPPPPSFTAAPAPPRVPAPPLGTPTAPSPEDAAEAEVALPTLPPHVGSIAIVEATVGSSALESQLLRQLKESAAAGEQVVLWTVTPGCEPCEAVGRSLSDVRMQKALSKVRLVRADAGSFPAELQRLGVPIDTVPGFTLLDARAHAADHIHGGEWDDDIPANIAPVLAKFVRHSFSTRRHPWARPLREGETPL